MSKDLINRGSIIITLRDFIPFFYINNNIFFLSIVTVTFVKISLEPIDYNVSQIINLSTIKQFESSRINFGLRTAYGECVTSPTIQLAFTFIHGNSLFHIKRMYV